MEKKHTQNLQIWGQQEKTEISGFYIVAADAPVAYVANRDDAVLFTHAPQLLEALERSQKAIRELRSNGAPTELWDDVEKQNISAIALATGSEVAE